MLRAILLLVLIGSISLSAWNLFQIVQNPAVSALIDRSQSELTANMNRELAKAATPDRIKERLETLIQEDPTPWLAITAVQDVAKFRKIPIPSDLSDAIQTEYDLDHGFLQTSGKCISCGWDASNCELSAILLCRAPVDLTPVGDITGVIRESGNYALGRDVDKIDLTLSAIGLGATAIAPATGGSSLAIKLGASTLKTTKKIGNLSPGLSRMLTRSADEAIDWQNLSKSGVRDFPDTLRKSVNMDALTPVTDTLKSAGVIRGSTSVVETLHLMKYLDTSQDAARTARISNALGPRTVSAFEVVGKSRLLRSSLRYSDEMIGAILSAIAAVFALIWLVLSTLMTRATRAALRRTS